MTRNDFDKYTYLKEVAFEEGSIESYDYVSKLTGKHFFSERSCYIEALNHLHPEEDYSYLTLFQLEAECLRNNIYVEILDN